MRNRIAATAIALAALAPSFAHPGVLYKSIDANGTITFSDTPPAGARILEERETTAVTSPSGAPQASSGPAPHSLLNAEQMLALDPQVAHANASVDLAERELASARRELAPLFEGARLEPYRKNLKIARQHLAEILRDRRIAGATPAPPRIALR